MVKNYDTYEAERDAFRLYFYEKTKDMTFEEIAAFIYQEVDPIKKKYGFQVISSAEELDRKLNTLKDK
ncbi:MAG: hypothetical protein LBS60_13840 [Deltaproteobacteria bacterium]|jgi:hypothetical protein|nr:hypothetical protein [Deltaproteobacteria bacterium]